MKVYIRAQSPLGMATVPRARRHWPVGQNTEVEVLDEEENLDDLGFPGTKPENKFAVEETLPDGTVRRRHHPTRIGKNTLEVLKKDHRISVLSDPKSQEFISQAGLEAAREEAGRQSQRAGQLESELATLRAENEQLKRQLAELGQPGTAPSGQMPPPPAEGETTHKESTGRRGR
jgi:hypothetical protein